MIILIQRLQVLQILCLLGFTGAQNRYLTRSIYVPDFDLLGSLSVYSTSAIYELSQFKESCFRKYPAHKSGQSDTFYKDTETFYKSVATSTGLDVSLEADYSLQTTLQTQSKSIAGSSNRISGNALKITAQSETHAIDKTCLVNNNPPFTSNFIDDLSRLPTKIDKPWLKNSWRDYDIFLSKYGSHVFTEITTGSEINQRSFAKFSKSYSERDFAIKSCIGLSGPTQYAKLGVKLCASITTKEVQRVTSLTMSTSLSVNGGTAATRSKFFNTEITKELIETFMNEADKSDAPVQYKLYPIWDIIKQAFMGRSDNLIKGVNMESYYLGYLNYGCGLKEAGGGLTLQMFNLVESSSSYPQYECTLAKEGCHSTDDCHNQFGVWCACKGDSCVGYKTDALDTNKKKTIAYINYKGLRWYGCDWKIWGLYCACYNDDRRMKVWPASTAHLDLVYLAHHRLSLCDEKHINEL